MSQRLYPEPAVATHTVRVFNLRLWLPPAAHHCQVVMAFDGITRPTAALMPRLQRFC